METIEYDSKFQLQAKEDAVKYKQKLFAEELFSQSLQIQSLQSENKILKATIEEDKDVLKENLGYIEELLDEKKSWDKKDRDAEAEAKIKKLQQSIVTKDTQFEEHKKELIAKYESLIRRSSAEFEENERSLLATHERQISSILGEKNEKQDKILQEKLQECKADVLKETNKVIQKEKELVNLKDRMEAEIKTGIFHKRLDANVENLLVKKRQEDLVERLRNEVLRLRGLPDLTNDLAKSHKQCEDLKMIIKRKNTEILNLKKDEKALVDDLAKEKDRNLITNLKLEKEKEKSKSLDQKFRISETEHMKNKARLSQNLNENKVLKGRVADLHSKLRGCQPLLIKGRVKTQDMETYIMRCKEDIQAVADITDPKKLIIGVAHLKAQHVDGDDRVPMEENTRTGYRHMVDGLMHQVKGLARVHTADAKLVERTRDEVNCFNQRKINLCVEKTNIINETTHEVLALKAKLRLTEKNLEKATDTTPKRVDSWLDEKYLRKTRTVSEETMFSEETLGHFPRVKRINVSLEDNLQAHQPHEDENDLPIIFL
ncbi:Laminin subunit alpha-2 [Dissostichus eleginoides]|uniref:Laminin subunit alpha-2 n=1 Tax=Dissostichus eleginoides TaxID=100907 RepID=A0AAD9BZD1_DISEL|nr:Laminin subunit alpha-2 [Dissostichus eleginoides]